MLLGPETKLLSQFGKEGVIEMLRYTPKRYQKGLINDFIRATQRQEEQVLKKINKETV